MVCVLVLRMAGVTSDPPPLGFVRRYGRHGFLPQLQVLDRSSFALPTALDPRADPGIHSFDDVLGIAGEQDFVTVATAGDFAKRFDYGPESHSVVGGPWIGDPVVIALARVRPRMKPLYHAAGAARSLAVAAVAQTRLLGIDCHQVPISCPSP